MTKDFITAQPDKGSNDGNIIFAASFNTEAEPRYTTVNVTGGGVTRSVDCFQSDNNRGLIVKDEIYSILRSDVIENTNTNLRYIDIKTKWSGRQNIGTKFGILLPKQYVFLPGNKYLIKYVGQSVTSFVDTNSPYVMLECSSANDGISLLINDVHNSKIEEFFKTFTDSMTEGALALLCVDSVNGGMIGLNIAKSRL